MTKLKTDSFFVY